MAIDAPLLAAVGGLVSGGFTVYWTVKTFYVKRADEQRDRASAELARVQRERQEELERYAEGKTKEYAAQRDFNHLMRQYEALSNNLNTLHELGDRRLDDIEADLRDIKGLLQMLAVHAGQTETGIQRYLKRED